ncbi:MAG TPA: hypothetical protein VHM30_11395 [Gemmatimonadaceae bacterium]|nr:hypothetical protein [Gemmatimonadaceae bacterium]
MLRRLAPFALVALAATALPRVSRAQELATPSTETVTTTQPAAQPAAPAGPTIDNATIALKRQADEQSMKAPVVMARRGTGDQATALMIVGGAAFLAGALIRDDAGTIIMVGGAAVGLYGLYLYLQ